MYISWNWLQRHVDLADIDPQELGEQFTLKVAELDGITQLGDNLDGVRAVRVISVDRLEGSDKLSRVVVQDGDRTHTVACGAPNAKDAVGRIVALCTPGTTLPNGLEIKTAEIRGLTSEGMLASEAELGLSDDHDGILILGDDVQSGVELTTAIPVNDWIFEVDNKAITHRPDLWGHHGIAREVALLANRELRPLNPTVTFGSNSVVSAKVIDSTLCPRYLCAYFTGVKVGPSPEWLKCLLRATGVRPINNVVDLTNYVMLDTGNPMHAFDARFVAGNSIEVRRATDGEVVRTLDGQDRTCTEETLLICDSEKPVAVAGIMGGENSEIRDDTTEVILEAANFDAGNIRRTSVRLGLRTESSARFEKSLDPAMCEMAARQFSHMMVDMIPGCQVTSPLIDVAADPKPSVTISLDPTTVSSRLGLDVPNEQIHKTLSGLGFELNENQNGLLDVIVPSWRATKDVSIPEDLIEEVGRIHGYENIPPQSPRVAIKQPHLTPAKAQERRTRRFLSSACGMHETLSYAFTYKPMLEKLNAALDGRLMMANSISADLDRLRRSLMPNLLNFAERNSRYFDRFGLYEMGRVFESVDGELPQQDRWVGAVMVCNKSDAESHFRRIKGVVDGLLSQLGVVNTTYRRANEDDLQWRNAWHHPARSAVVEINGTIVGWLGLLHPKANRTLDINGLVALMELHLDGVLPNCLAIRSYEPLPRFPGIELDVSFEVDETIQAQQLMDAIHAGANTTLLRECTLFDNYHLDNGKKSVSFHLMFRSDEGSLTDSDVKGPFDAMVAHVSTTLSASLRGG